MPRSTSRPPPTHPLPFRSHFSALQKAVREYNKLQKSAGLKIDVIDNATREADNENFAVNFTSENVENFADLEQFLGEKLSCKVTTSSQLHVFPDGEQKMAMQLRLIYEDDDNRSSSESVLVNPDDAGVHSVTCNSIFLSLFGEVSCMQAVAIIFVLSVLAVFLAY